MKTNIFLNIQEIRRKIISGEEPGLAEQIALHGRDAIFAGIGTFEGGVVTAVTPEWETLMNHFAENEDELKRLCGQVLDFNNSDWGLQCLAYIAGDSTCTSETTLATGTSRSMLLHPERNMVENLDRDFPV